MFVTVINDCRDGNTMGRQATRLARLFQNASIATVGIGWSELEGAGNLIDMLDASDGQKGIILANVAPRHGRGKLWPNGTPFGYFYYQQTLIISTIAEQMLSLVKKFGIVSTLRLTEVATVIEQMIEKGQLDSKLREVIIRSQFRSYDYMPRLAKWIMDGIEVPSTAYSFANVPDVRPAVWWVDNFGNCKTTLLPEEIAHQPGTIVETKIGSIKCYQHLKDVPNDQAGITIGSSGLHDKRFLEIVVQGGSAAEQFKLKPGSEIL